MSRYGHHRNDPRNETYILIRGSQIRKPVYDCRDFSGCIDAPEFIPLGGCASKTLRDDPSRHEVTA